MTGVFFLDLLRSCPTSLIKTTQISRPFLLIQSGLDLISKIVISPHYKNLLELRISPM